MGCFKIKETANHNKGSFDCLINGGIWSFKASSGIFNVLSQIFKVSSEFFNVFSCIFKEFSEIFNVFIWMNNGCIGILNGKFYSKTGIFEQKTTFFMKKLTREEANQLKWVPDGKSSYARTILMAMNKGEIILLEKKDWNQKRRTPGTYCLMLGRKTKREWTCRKLADGTGWIVERVK